MTFDPLQERGIPLDRQLRTWRELNVTPVDPDRTDPYTRCRVLTVNAVETAAVHFSHSAARHCADPEARRRLARVRYVEAQQQKAVNWLLPGVASVLETTLAYEQTLVDLTAWAARNEPDPHLRQAYHFGVLEDVDHLYRFANLYELVEHRPAETVVGHLTEVMPGRPTPLHHRDASDDLREPYDRSAAAPLSKLHVRTVLAVARQAADFYATVGPLYMEPAARRLYQEIGMVEEEHTTHYESLADPAETWWERLVLHEYTECWLYHSFHSQESDPKVRAVWELHLGMELEHLRIACELLRADEGRDPAEVVGRGLPDMVRFEPSKAYLRELIADQLDVTTLGTGYVREVHERLERVREAVNGEEGTPSDQVMEQHQREFDRDYRVQDGQHPVPALSDHWTHHRHGGRRRTR